MSIDPTPDADDTTRRWTPEESLTEIATLLAGGLIRLRDGDARLTETPNGESRELVRNPLEASE